MGTDLSDELVEAVRAAGNPADAVQKARYFQVRPGGYGEGDEFAGVSVPQLRKLARSARAQADPADVEALFAHRWNEVRQLGGLLLIELYQRGDEAFRERAIELLLRNRHRLNNWNLVDATVRDTLGAWLLAHPERRPLLEELLASDSPWDRRIAIVSTFTLIRAGQSEDLLRLAARTLDDRNDLIHKATGWMLREVGQRDRAALDGFLDLHARQMPRTMLRYAIEKHSPEQRRGYLGR